MQGFLVCDFGLTYLFSLLPLSVVSGIRRVICVIPGGSLAAGSFPGIIAIAILVSIGNIASLRLIELVARFLVIVASRLSASISGLLMIDGVGFIPVRSLHSTVSLRLSRL